MTKILTLIIFAGLVTMAFFAIQHDKTPMEPTASTLKNIEKPQTVVKPKLDEIDYQQFTDRLPTPSKGAVVTRQIGLTPERAVKQFKQTRNHLIADSTVSDAERQRTLDELAHALWGKDAVIPEETEADRQQQEKIKVQIQTFKHNVNQIKTDTSLNYDEKSNAISKLFKDFVNSPEE